MILKSSLASLVYSWVNFLLTLLHYSRCCLSFDKSTDSPKASSPQIAIWCFLLQFTAVFLNLCETAAQ